MNEIRFLVIGSNSFSGAHFVEELLKQGFPVWAVSRSNQPESVFLPYLWRLDEPQNSSTLERNFNFENINLNHELQKLLDIIDRNRITHIVNFASQGMVAESWLNPLDWYQTNLLSQVALHDELRKRQFLQKYLHITTPEVYGSTDNGWIKEGEAFSPSTPYAVSRAACDLHLQSFFQAYNFPVVFTRAANVYGPGQQLYRVIPRAMLSARTGKKFELHGGGLSKRSFIHIKDVVQATLLLALNADCGTTWHISTKESITIRGLVEKICRLCSVEFDSIVKIGDERLGKDQNYLLDSNNLRSAYGWSEQISLDIGLEQTLEWIDRNQEQLVSLPWTYSHKQ